jgi:hypothetical protein
VSIEAVKWALDDAPMLRTDAKKPDTTARAVLVALAERAYADGSNAYPSLFEIRWRTGYDRATVQRALRRLEVGGLIVSEGPSKHDTTKYRLVMSCRRPESDKQELKDKDEHERNEAAKRQAKVRNKKEVTDAKSVTVTDAESVTGSVTDAESERHGFKSRDVTDAESERHGRNAARTVMGEPSYGTVLEPPPSETPPTSESPPPGQLDLVEELPEPKAKPQQQAKPKPQTKAQAARTPEQQAAFDAADKISRLWWDRECPRLGIPVTPHDRRRFPGFRDHIQALLLAPCTPEEIALALTTCKDTWPSKSAINKAIGKQRRDGTDTKASPGDDRIAAMQALKDPEPGDPYDDHDHHNTIRGELVR